MILLYNFIPSVFRRYFTSTKGERKVRYCCSYMEGDFLRSLGRFLRSVLWFPSLKLIGSALCWRWMILCIQKAVTEILLCRCVAVDLRGHGVWVGCNQGSVLHFFDWSIDGLIVSCIDRLFVHSMDWLSNFSVDWLIDWIDVAWFTFILLPRVAGETTTENDEELSMDSLSWYFEIPAVHADGNKVQL